MNCEEALDRIDSGEAADEVLQAHLATCAGCRAAAQALQRVATAARDLPREMAPPRDLWPGIAAQLEPRGGLLSFPSRRLSFAPTTLAAAAALLVAVTASFTALVLRPGPPEQSANAALPGDAVARPVALSPEATVAAAELQYVQAQAALLAQIQASAEQLGPEAVATVEANVKVIDAALDEIRTALGQAPGNPALVRMLSSTHRKKLDVLQRVARSL